MSPQGCRCLFIPDPSWGESAGGFELPAGVTRGAECPGCGGRVLKVLANGSMPAGRQVAAFHGERLSAGVYIIRLNTAGRNGDEAGCDRAIGGGVRLWSGPGQEQGGVYQKKAGRVLAACGLKCRFAP